MTIARFLACFMGIPALGKIPFASSNIELDINGVRQQRT